MPKVTAAHLEARRRGILAAAQRCVARNGVAATRMSDICRAANLSPGGVYRYFSGKDEILAELAVQRQQQVERFFHTMSDRRKTRQELLSALRELAAALDGRSAQDGLHLDLHLWSEALSSPAVHSALAEGHGRIIERLAEALPGETNDDRKSTARALVALLQGLALQKALDPELELAPLVSRLTRM
jgi:AcrR family transcriptional regulator